MRLTARGHGDAPPPPGHRQLDRALLVVPERVAEPAPLLVFFHGAGGSGPETLWRVEDAAAEAGVVLLLPSSTDTTWDLLMSRTRPDVRAVDAALRQVLTTYAVGRVAFGGFSDGGSYALSLGLANGDLVGDLLAFSPGFAAPPQQVGVPRVWVSHGTDDRVLPVDRCGRHVARALGAAGYDVRYEEFVGAHVMPPDLTREALRWWLSDV